jgi:hypothetical protein
MFNVFKRKQSPSGNSQANAVDTDFLATRQDKVDIIGLVPIVWREILRMHGIPPSWVACEIGVSKMPSLHVVTDINLVVLHWNEQLLRYAPALEKELFTGLQQYELNADKLRLSVSWRFAANCGYPYAGLPEHIVWESPKMAAPAKADTFLDSRGNIRLE